MLLTDCVSLVKGCDPRTLTTAAEELPEGVAPVPVYQISGLVGYTDRPLITAPAVAIGVSGTVGRPVILEAPAWIKKTMMALVPVPGRMDLYYLQCLLDSLQWGYYTDVGVRTNLSPRFYAVTVPHPDLHAQQLIGKLHRGLSSMSTRSRTQAERLAQLKAFMLQELFC